MKNKNLLITGGATRIGKELAIHFSKKGWNISNLMQKIKI